MRLTKLIYLFLLILSMNSCLFTKEETINNEINLLELLIQPEDLPSNWSLANYGLGKATDLYRSSDSAGIVFFSDMNPEAFGVGQEVYRFKTIGGAKTDYLKVISSLSQPDEFRPVEWTYHSENADESYFSCTAYPNITICDWVARYKNIVIELGGPIMQDYFDLANFEIIVRKIDEKANTLIKASN